MTIEHGGSGSRATRASAVAILFAVVLVVLMGLPRFAQGRDVDSQKVGLTTQPNGWYLSYDDPDLDRDIAGFSFDIYEYHAYVDYFRDAYDRYPIYGPWRWRLVPSWLAAQTPIDDPAVAFAVVSLVFLVAGAVALVSTSARNGLGMRGQMLVGGLYAISFPLIWYGTSGYVDGSSMALICVGLALIQSRRWWLFVPLLVVGMLTKETFIIVVPIAGTFLWARARSRRDWLPITCAFAAVAVGTFIGARLMLPSPRTLDWYPRLGRLSWNLSRPQALGSFVLACGVVIPLALLGAWRLLNDSSASAEGKAALKEQLHLVVGFGLGLLVALHGFLTAYADGRHIWSAYPSGVLLAALFVTSLARRKERVLL